MFARRFPRVFGIAFALFSLNASGVQAEIASWRASPTQDGAIQARLRIEGRDLDLDLHFAKPSTVAGGITLLVETGTRDAFVAVAGTRNMAIAQVDLSRLPEALRSKVLHELIGKLKNDSGADHVLAHGVAAASPMLIENAAYFDGLLVENMAPPLSLKTPRFIALIGVDGFTKTEAALMAGAPEPANQRRFYLAGAVLAASKDVSSCMAPVNALSADPARRALLVALHDWIRGVKPPASRLPGRKDIAPARSLNWPTLPNLPAPPADDRSMVKIDRDGNETAGLRMPDQALPIATFAGFNKTRDKAANLCDAGATLPFAATRAARESTRDPRLSLVERYGSRAYFVATLRVIADKLVQEKLLLPSDADAYVAAGKVAPF
jgi:hypothetical protein